MLLAAEPAWCYRPYDSTDADVASDGEIEVEFGFTLSRMAEADVRGWGLVLNHGLGGDRELVVEGARTRTEVSDFPAQTSFSDVALSLKQVVRRGTLQEQSGASVAVECGTLIPVAPDENNLGGECALIASQAMSMMSLHLSAAVSYGAGRTWRRSVGLIVEGTDDRVIRPGLEILNDRAEGEPSEWSALMGLTWRASNRFAADLAYRHSIGSTDELNEWRLGFTWSIAS
jgi:hypothetical protein